MPSPTPLDAPVTMATCFPFLFALISSSSRVPLLTRSAHGESFINAILILGGVCGQKCSFAKFFEGLLQLGLSVHDDWAEPRNRFL
jgi:hypothetical protein